MENTVEARPKISHGLWVDDPPKVVLNEGYFRSLKDCHIGTVAVMIDRSDREWKSTWRYKEIEDLFKLADKDCIEVVLTTWPYPDKEQIKSMCIDMGILMSTGPTAGWEVDLEFNWKRNLVRGFHRTKEKGSLDLAGDYLVNRIREVCKKYDARFEVTSFTQHTENGAKADVAPHCDRLMVQAYSVRKRPGVKSPISWDHVYGPGQMQLFTLQRSMTVPGVSDGKPELGCGLAAWSQRWPNRTPNDAMEFAYYSAVDYNPVVDVRWWSSKHVIGVKKNPYAAKFLESLQ